MNNFILNKEKLTPFIQKLKNKEPSLFVTLGDSNTGNFWFTAGAKQWPELIQTQLRQVFDHQQIMLFNAGICGETVSAGLQRIERDVLRFTPDLVIVTFATNDNGKFSPEAFLQNLELLVKKILDTGAMVLLRTVPPVMEHKPEPKHIWKPNEKLAALIVIIRNTAEKFNIPFIDIHGIWTELENEGRLSMGDMMIDEVHTNDKGHKLIAKQILWMFDIDKPFHFEVS